MSLIIMKLSSAIDSSVYRGDLWPGGVTDGVLCPCRLFAGCASRW